MEVPPPEQVLGDQFGKRFITDFSIFRDEPFMFSIYPLYNSPTRRRRWKDGGVHPYAKHNGRVMLDSGGFQLIRKEEHLDFNQTVKIFREAKMEVNDTCIQLDFCPLPRLLPKERLATVHKSGKAFLEMRKLAPELKMLFVTHGWTRKELKASLEYAKRESLISLGSYLAMLALPANLTMLTIKPAWSSGTNQGAMRDAIIQRFITFDEIVRRDPDLKDLRVHVLGATGANSSHLSWFMGFEQTDSSSWRIKAAYGKIALINVAEVSVSKRPYKFGKVEWREKHDILLKACMCPMCDGLNLKERKDRLGDKFEFRAIHNAFTYLEERNIARDLAGTMKYERYLQRRFARSWFWKKFLRKVRGSRSQVTLDQYLKVK